MPTTVFTGPVNGAENGENTENSPALGPKTPTKHVRKRSKVTKPRSRATENIPTLPKPPGNKVRIPQKLFEYWEMVNKLHPDRLLLYVYRTWPIIDRKRHGKHSNIGSLSQPVNEDGIYAEFGEGDYKLILSDGIGYKQVCYTLLKGFRDAINFPAQIELEDVVTEDPQNKSWIERMRMKGTLFPGDEDEAMEEQISGNMDAVSQLTSTVKELAMSHMRNRDTPKQNLETSVGSAMLDNVAQASRMGNEIIKEAVTQASQLAVTPASGANPVEQMLAVAEMVKAIVPAPQPQQDMMPLFTVMMESTKANAAAQLEAANQRATSFEKLIDSMRSEIVEMRKPKEDQQDPLKQIVKLAEAQKVLMEVNPSSGDASSVPAWVQAVLPAIPVVVQMLSQAATAFATGMYNKSVAATGVGQAMPPPAPQAAQAPAVIPNTAAPAPGGAPTEDQTGRGAYMGFLQQIADPLLAHIQNPDLNGADFADWLTRYGPNGQMIYMSLREQGKDQLVLLLQTHEPLWSQLQQIPEVFNRFLDEFMAYSQQQDEEPDEEQELAASPEPQEPNPQPLEELPPKPANATTATGKPTGKSASRKSKKGVN